VKTSKKAKIMIPARLNSQRLPGKPLMDIQGKPMVIRVAEKCIAAIGRDDVLVSTPDSEIAEACSKFGINFVRSSIDCLSGTDRLFEFMKSCDDELIINVQGDEPMIPVSVVRDFYSKVTEMNQTCVGISQIFDESYVKSRSVVKVAFSNESLVYASREAIGGVGKESERTYFKHTGLYSFTRDDIFKFGESERGTLELAENVEILRLLERGVPVKVVEVPNYGRAVDTVKDFEFVIKYGQFEDF
jgi:3-deoxy-manno-octulosonate cytidylyltransferase (CMP-KDO synthetase)